jgi:hypothetical protein
VIRPGNTTMMTRLIAEAVVMGSDLGVRVAAGSRG